MNIIIVTHAFNESYTSLLPRYSLIRLVNHLSKYENIIIISSKLAGAKNFEIIKRKLRIYRFKPTLYFPNIPYIIDFLQFIKILKVCKKENCDIIIGYGLQFFSCFSAAIASKIGGYTFFCRIVGESTTTNNYFLDIIAKIYDLIFSRIVLKISDIVLVQSSRMRYRPLRLGTPIEKVKVIGDGIDFLEFNNVDNAEYLKNELNIKKSDIIITFASRLVKLKGIMDLINVAKVIVRENRNVVFLIAGSGPLEDKLKKEIKQIKNIKILGYRDDIPKLLKISNIFIHPSYSEGLSPAIMEACASGLPIITTNIGSNSDIITNGLNGFLFQPGDKNAMKSYIMKLIQDQLLREKMGKYNQDFIRNNYSLDKISKKFIEYLRTFHKKTSYS